MGYDIEFDESICRDPEAASAREWLESNGIGGYASGTVSGIHTRRYHGLLVAATQPPAGRYVLLSKFEEIVTIGGTPFELSANRYPGVTHPQGYRFLKHFRLQPFPTFVYEAGGVEIEKTIFLAHGENTVVIRYSFHGVADCRLELRPLIAFRDYHSTTHENGAIQAELEFEAGNIKLSPYPGLPSLYLAHSNGAVTATGTWYRNFEYDRERKRGLDYREDLFNPCSIVFEVPAGGVVNVIAAMSPNPIERALSLREWEERRRLTIGREAPARGAFVDNLTRAADQFVVQRGPNCSILAGYHWFTDWGRDAMISLPGLLLSTGRMDKARSVLQAFAGAVDQGMLPNRFPDCGETPEYNTVDATLWFFEAARAYAARSEDFAFIANELYPILRDVISHHVRGTRYGIKVDSDALLQCGAPGVQLTWMDARVGDWVVTPRQGKPVEIQALWYNALRVMEDFSARLNDAATSLEYHEMAGRARAAFCDLFWNSAENCLYDVIEGANRDPSIRPNQIFALSLHHKMLPADRSRSILDTVQHHLLTPYGLRTLAPSDPAYRGRFEGDPHSRDGAYHQGTAWPWLLGPFVTAYLDCNGRTPQTRQQVEEWLAPLRDFLYGQGVGQIPEVFDGDAPQRAGGCIAQAWSVAELLRVCVEELAG